MKQFYGGFENGMPHYTLIVEDHPLYREGLGDTLSMILTDTVVLKASSAEEGLLMTDHLQDVRLICLDLGLPKLQGVDAVTTFKAKFPNAVLIVISGNEQIDLQRHAVECGANAFIAKTSTPNEIASLVHKAVAGEWLAPRVDLYMNGAGDPQQVKPFLTARQNEVLQLLSMGLTNKEIAKHLDVAEVTVKLHVSGIFRVFGVNCRSKALMIARNSGLLTVN